MDPILVKKVLEIVEDKMLFEGKWKRIRSALIKLQESEESSLAELMLSLPEEDLREIEKLGGFFYPFPKGKECFKYLCKELVKRDWALQREKMRMEIQSGRLEDEEAVRLAQELVRMGRFPPETNL